MKKAKVVMRLCIFLAAASCVNAGLPVVVGTWGFKDAVVSAWDVLRNSNDPKVALDAIEAGCSRCEEDQCDGSVGFGGSPDENGDTRLDAMIMDGTTANVGAVGSIGNIKSAARVARHVLENTRHTLLVGDLATDFAKQMGFKEESLNTNHSLSEWKNWKKTLCQPNFWENVSPDPTASCGPYKPANIETNEILGGFGDAGNHDTIGLVAIDRNGKVAAGTSTNGATFKIPGRVGDSPIPGSGAYADSDVGGAAATGDGDVMMRFLPSFLAVELMRGGMPPTLAAETAIGRIVKKHPNFSGALIALNKRGTVGAACHGLKEPFPFSVGSPLFDGVRVLKVKCIDDKY